MAGGATLQIRATLAAQRDRLEAHRALETERDVRRCWTATRRAWMIARTTRLIVGDSLAPLERELRWVAELLGPVHDLDTLLAHVRPQIEALGEDADGARLLVAALAQRRLFRHRELKAAAESPRYSELITGFYGLVETIPSLNGSLRPVTARELERLRAAAARFTGSPTDLVVHVIGLRASRARYVAELAGTAQAERRARALARVQKLTGAHQDAVIAEVRLRSLSRPKTAQAVGRLIEREHVRKRAQRAALPGALAKALRGE